MIVALVAVDRSPAVPAGVSSPFDTPPRIV